MNILQIEDGFNPEEPSAQAVEFLSRMVGQVLDIVAIWPSGKLEGARLTDRDAARAWIDERDGHAGLYYHVNSLRHAPASGRAKKKDVAAFCVAALDIDPPPAAVNIRIWRSRKVRDLREDRCPPTSIVHSGNGIHAYWRLEDPLPINSQADIDRAETINKSLRDKFGGDKGTWNIDRIFRIPFTLNIKSSDPVRSDVIDENDL